MRMLGWIGLIGMIVTAIFGAVSQYMDHWGNPWLGAAVRFNFVVIAFLLLMVACWEKIGFRQGLAWAASFVAALPLTMVYVTQASSAREGEGMPYLWWMAIPLLVHLGAGCLVMFERNWGRFGETPLPVADAPLESDLLTEGDDLAPLDPDAGALGDDEVVAPLDDGAKGVDADDLVVPEDELAAVDDVPAEAGVDANVDAKGIADLDDLVAAEDESATAEDAPADAPKSDIVSEPAEATDADDLVVAEDDLVLAADAPKSDIVSEPAEATDADDLVVAEDDLVLAADAPKSDIVGEAIDDDLVLDDLDALPGPDATPEQPKKKP